MIRKCKLATLISKKVTNFINLKKIHKASQPLERILSDCILKNLPRISDRKIPTCELKRNATPL